MDLLFFFWLLLSPSFSFSHTLLLLLLIKTLALQISHLLISPSNFFFIPCVALFSMLTTGSLSSQCFSEVLLLE